MNVSTEPRVENCFMARKSAVISANDEAIACERFHSHCVKLCLEGELVNHGRLMAPLIFGGVLCTIKNTSVYTLLEFT